MSAECTYRIRLEDVTEPRRGSDSPWGTVDRATPIAEGIVFVSTPSHGGFWLSPARLAEIVKISPRNHKTFGDYAACWYEEDCEASKVVNAFGHLFPESLKPPAGA